MTTRSKISDCAHAALIAECFGLPDAEKLTSWLETLHAEDVTRQEAKAGREWASELSMKDALRVLEEYKAELSDAVFPAIAALVLNARTSQEVSSTTDRFGPIPAERTVQWAADLVRRKVRDASDLQAALTLFVAMPVGNNLDAARALTDSLRLATKTAKVTLVFEGEPCSLYAAENPRRDGPRFEVRGRKGSELNTTRQRFPELTITSR